MKITDKIALDAKKNQPTIVPTSKKMNGFVTFMEKMSMIPTPRVIESRTDRWVLNNKNNSFFQVLKNLMTGSGMHNTLIKSKQKMMAGDGFLLNDAKTDEESRKIYNEMPEDQKKMFDWFVENPLDHMNMFEIIEKLTYDYQYSGSYCYEVFWNLEFTQIVRIRYVDIENVAPEKPCVRELANGKKVMDDHVSAYWFSADWANYKREEFTPVRIAAFNPNDKENMNQLVYVKAGPNKYFGEPSYQGAITWINVDNILGTFHESNISNGLSPSLLFKVYESFDNDEEREYFLHNIRSQLYVVAS